MGRKILDKNRTVLDTAAKLLRQRVQGFFSNVDEFFAFHRSPTDARARSFRVAVIILVIIAVFFAVAFVFLFVFFGVWPVSNADTYQRFRRL